MSDIFISYKREEREKARIIASVLVKQGYDVWWDVELLPGDRFANEIDEVIKRSKVAIILWSKKAVESEFIRAEANRANSKKSMISVKLDECEIPLPYNIHHFLDLSQWDNSEESPLLQILLKAIEKKAGVKSTSTVQSKSEVEHKVERPKNIDEIEYWKSISKKVLPSVGEYQAYITKYGKQAIFYDLALIRIKETNLKPSNSKKIIISLIIVASIVVGVFWMIFTNTNTNPNPNPNPNPNTNPNPNLKPSLCSQTTPANEARQLLFDSIRLGDEASFKDCASNLIPKSINFLNQHGHSPLASAASHGRLELVKLLVRRNADINIVSSKKAGGGTPLHYAIKHGHRKVAKFLICKNALKNLKDSKGKIPLDYDASDFYKNVQCK